MAGKMNEIRAHRKEHFQVMCNALECLYPLREGFWEPGYHEAVFEEPSGDITVLSYRSTNIRETVN